jgi:hypothetical protein
VYVGSTASSAGTKVSTAPSDNRLWGHLTFTTAGAAIDREFHWVAIG